MRIVVNTRLLLSNKLEGIGWFSYQVLKRITQNNPNVHFVFVFDRPFSNEFIFNNNITPIIVGPQARHPVLYYSWLQLGIKSVLNRMKPELFLSPDGFLSLGSACRQLPVIHDINFLHYPGHNKWLTAKYYNHFFPRFAKAATRIATVSQFSKNDIVQNYGINANKIDVVYNGINSFFKPAINTVKQQTKLKYTQGKDYFICLGSLHPRKNIVGLVKAFALFKKESGSNIKLLLAGAAFWGIGEINKSIKECAMQDEVVITGRLPDEELANVMGSALAMTFVPFYEGFGIPLVEAMEAGIPIIASNVSSLPEVVGDAALLVNPGNVTEIKNAMIMLFNNRELQNNMVQKGLIQKQKFSWDRSAGLLWDSIARAIGQGGRIA